MSNLTFSHNVLYAICISKSFKSHISVVVCSFFEYGTVSKWCIREWVNVAQRVEFVFAWIENISGKGENAGYQQFLYFLRHFRKAPSSIVRILDCVVN